MQISGTARVRAVGKRGSMGEKLTGFDLDDDFDLDLDLDSDGDDKDVIPKSRVTEIVQKRLAREKGKVEKAYSEFKRVYGMTPEEAVAFGQQELQQTRAATPAQGQQPTDPVLGKIAELDARWQQMEATRTLEREAAEFVQAFPNLKFDQVPKEVLDRRAAGGVTLTEAYRLLTADQKAQDAARKAAEAATRGMRSRDNLRVEGADYTGGSGADAGALTPEEREFAQKYGMSSKDYVAYKQRVHKMQEGDVT